VEPAAIDDHHHLFAGFAEGGHHLMHILLRSWHGEELAPRHLRAWQALRHDLDRRRQQLVHRRRFRRDPGAYLAALEKGLLQLILPS
jgi:hypothetical protein